MKQKPDNRLPIVIDTREQLPFFLHPHWNEKITKTVKGLTSGDYSLIGFENMVTIDDTTHSFWLTVSAMWMHWTYPLPKYKAYPSRIGRGLQEILCDPVHPVPSLRPKTN